MNATKIERMLDLISEIVDNDGTWQEKRDAVLAECSSEMKMQLEEFVGWFNVEE